MSDGGEIVILSIMLLLVITAWVMLNRHYLKERRAINSELVDLHEKQARLSIYQSMVEKALREYYLSAVSDGNLSMKATLSKIDEIQSSVQIDDKLHKSFIEGVCSTLSIYEMKGKAQ